MTGGSIWRRRWPWRRQREMTTSFFFLMLSAFGIGMIRSYFRSKALNLHSFWCWQWNVIDRNEHPGSYIIAQIGEAALGAFCLIFAAYILVFPL